MKQKGPAREVCQEPGRAINLGDPLRTSAAAAVR